MRGHSHEGAQHMHERLSVWSRTGALSLGSARREGAADVQALHAGEASAPSSSLGSLSQEAM